MHSINACFDGTTFYVLVPHRQQWCCFADGSRGRSELLRTLDREVDSNTTPQTFVAIAEVVTCIENPSNEDIIFLALIWYTDMIWFAKIIKLHKHRSVGRGLWARGGETHRDRERNRASSLYSIAAALTQTILIYAHKQPTRQHTTYPSLKVFHFFILCI